MATLFNDPAILQHHDQVRIDDGRKPVGDGDDGAALPHFLQGILNIALCLAVERAGCFVQQQDRRVFQQGSRNAHALLFTARQLEPAFADLSGIAFGHFQNKFMDFGGLRRSFDLFTRGIRAAVGDVVIDGIIEQNRILRHDADQGMKAILRNVAHILPIDAECAARNIVEPEQQTANGGFSRPRRADKGQCLARADGDRDIFQDRPCGFIGEVDVIEPNLATLDLQGQCAGFIQHFGGLVQQREHFAHIGQRLPDLSVHGSQKVKRCGNLDHVGIDHDEIADRQRTLVHLYRGHDHDDDQANRDDQALTKVQHCQRHVGFNRGFFIQSHRTVIPAGFARFCAKVFHGFEVKQAVNRLLVGIRILIIHRLADFHPHFGDGKREPDIKPDGDGDDGQVAPVKVKKQDGPDQQQFQDQRADGKHQEPQQEIHAFHATLYNPG